MTIHAPAPVEVATEKPVDVDLSVVAPPAPSQGVLGRHRRRALLVVRVVADVVGFALPAFLVSGQPLPVLVAAVLLVAALAQGNLYRARLHLSVLDEVPGLLARVAAVAGGAALVVAVTPAQRLVADLLVGSLAGAAGLLVARSLVHALVREARSRGLVRHRTLVVGGGVLAADLVQTLRDHTEYGLDPVGYVDASPSASRAFGLVPYLGPPSALRGAVERADATVLLVAFGNTREVDLVGVLTAGDAAGLEVFVVPRFYEAFGNNSGDHIGAVPVVRRRRASLRGPAPAVKRAFDVVCSGLALLVLSPVLLACALAVRLEGGPGVIFRQERVGKDGELFELLKFRSLRPADETESAVHWNIARDSRMGPVGRFLRRRSLDELPQLWNILRGDMTIVGPRPERPFYVDRFSHDVPRYRHRHRVPVGLTGLAQVSGLRGDTSIRDRARYDNYYIENWSLWLDVKVILRTVREVVGARGG